MAIKLKPDSETAYRQYHAAVWPDVLKKITECNVKNYSIFFKDNMLFSYFEYYGNKWEEDCAKMAADPKTQEWWEVMKPMQEPLPSRADGDWWATMEEVFHLD
jgi:L-rhamnose mutarotase